MDLQTTSTMEIIWISIRDLLNIHHGDRGRMEVWRLYGPPMDVMFCVGRLSRVMSSCRVHLHSECNIVERRIDLKLMWFESSVLFEICRVMKSGSVKCGNRDDCGVSRYLCVSKWVMRIIIKSVECGVIAVP